MRRIKAIPHRSVPLCREKTVLWPAISTLDVTCKRLDSKKLLESDPPRNGVSSLDDLICGLQEVRDITQRTEHSLISLDKDLHCIGMHTNAIKEELESVALSRKKIRKEVADIASSLRAFRTETLSTPRYCKVVDEHEKLAIYNNAINEDVLTAADALNKGFALLYADKLLANRAQEVFLEGLSMLEGEHNERDRDLLKEGLTLGVECSENSSMWRDPFPDFAIKSRIE